MNQLLKHDWATKAVDRINRFYSKLFGTAADAFEEGLLEEGWQTLATLESIKPMFPTLVWPKNGQINARAKFVGGLLGHSVAHYEAMCLPRVWKLVCDAIDKLETYLNPDTKLEPVTENENPFVEARASFNHAVGGALRAASRQTISEQIQFFEGYTKALRKGAVTLTAKGVSETTRTSGYQFIAVFGPLIKERCRSVHDVHRFLELMMGRQRAGSVKRTEAICKKLGMTFRRAGRPSKSPRDLGAEESCS